MYKDSRQYFRELYSDERWKSLSECYGFDANADRFSTSDVLTWSQGEGSPAPQAPLPALIGAYLLAGGEVELGRTGPTRRHDASVHRSPSVVKVLLEAAPIGWQPFVLNSYQSDRIPSHSSLLCKLPAYRRKPLFSAARPSARALDRSVVATLPFSPDRGYSSVAGQGSWVGVGKR